MKRISSVVYIILFIVFSCNEKQSQICSPFPENSELFYTIIDTLSFNVDASQYNFEASFVNETSDDVLFGGYDSYNHTIECYSIKSRSQNQVIQLQKGGEPHAINGEISSVLYHSIDSIFLAENGYHVIYLINSKGQLLRSWNFLDHESKLKGKNFTGLYGLGAITKFGMNLFSFDEKTLLSHFGPISSNDDYMFSTFYSLPPLAKLDLDKNKLTEYIGEFPPDYQGDMIPYTPFVSYCMNTTGDISIIYSSSNYMYSTGSEGFRCLTSKYYSPSIEKKYSSSDIVDPDKFYEELEKNGAFQRILFDKYRNLYFVVVKHPIVTPDDDGYYDKYLSSWSLIKLDNNLKPIGECKMEKSKYDYTNIFIVPDGIMISLENPYNSNNREDFIEFEIITL